ncbi:hypothetical protein E143388_07509 [Rhodococcus opacus]|nr:hypothetical protein E143388_07509 [Rhodococcus opacus]
MISTTPRRTSTRVQLPQRRSEHPRHRGALVTSECLAFQTINFNVRNMHGPMRAPHGHICEAIGVDVAVGRGESV